MNKDKIIQELSKRGYIQKIRAKMKDRLGFTMRKEYLGTRPAEYEKVAGTNLSHPIFHATVDMLISSLLYGFVCTVIDEVIDVIEEIKEAEKK